jgi:transcription initiation factor TFIIH subunit 2
MADSDHDYDEDDDVVVQDGGRRGMVSRPKDRGQARWEEAASRNWELQEAPDGSIEGVLGGLEEAGKRKRCWSCFYYHTIQTDRSIDC